MKALLCNDGGGAPSRLPRNPYPEAFMRSFQPPPETRFYGGVDLHASPLYLVVLDRDGQVRFGRNLPAAPEPSCAPSSPFATACSSPASASTPGTGWPTPAATTPSPLSSAMPGR